MWRWETITEKRALTNDDVAYDQLELTVHALIHGRDDKGKPLDAKGELHVTYALPLPADAPSTGRTAAVKPSAVAAGSADAGAASWEHRVCVGVKRAAQRTVLRAVEKRPAVFEVFRATSGFMGFGATTVCVGKGALPLDALLSDSTLDIAVPLHAPDKIPDALAVVKGDAIVPPSIIGSRARTVSPAAGTPAAAGAGAGGAGGRRSSGAAAAAGSVSPPGGAAASAAAALGADDGLAAGGEGERGALHVTLRLHVPLRDQALQFVERRVLVMQKLPPLSSLSAPLPPAAALPPTPVPAAAAASGAAGARPAAAAAAGASVPAAAAPAAGAASATKPAAAGAATSAAASVAASRAAAQRDAALVAAEFGPAATKSGGGAAGKAGAGVAGGAGAGGGVGAGDDEEEAERVAHMDVKHYVSFDAMRAETERCNARMAELAKGGTAGDEDEASDLSFRVMALGIQMSTLESRVDAGQLSFDAYLAQVDAAIKADAALAKALIGKGRADAAAQVMGRIRIMKAEVDGARKQMAEMAAAEAAGAAGTPV